MAKIPLESTISSTYRFAFTNILSVFGVLWLPTAIFLGLIGVVLYFAWPDLQGMLPVDLNLPDDSTRSHHLSQEQLEHLMHLFFVFGRFAGLISLVGLVFRAMIAVGVLEKALGKREGPVFVYFSLGAPVWRMVGALLLIGILIVCLVLATCALGALLIWAADTYAAGISGLVKFFTIFGGVLWVIYAAVRLSFFLPPLVVAEERIGIVRAWSLGGGNFWRIVVLMIAVILPAAIVGGMLQNALFGMLWWDDMHKLFAADHTVMPREFVMTILHSLQRTWPFLLAFQIVYATILTGLGLGAMANAYKGATAEAPA